MNSRIHDIQKFGEFALLAVLLPYYVSHLLVLFMPEQVVPILTTLIWTSLAAWAFYTISKNYKVTVGVLFLGLVLSAVFVVSVSRWSDNSSYSIFPRFAGTPSEQLKVESELLNVESELLKVQKAFDTNLLNTQNDQLKIQKDVLGLLDAEREKKEGAPPRFPPKHPGRSVQLQRVAH